LNFLLSFNRKYVLILALAILLLSFIFFTFKFYSNDNKLIDLKITITNVDITQPRFAINSPTQKILVTAKEGNFLGDNQILLKKSVKFSSNKFSIESDNVTFDREAQTAYSKSKSIFKSKNTTISAEGFNIYDNGNKIKFFGQSRVILK
tara:strand:- start:11776 stop:12222 length:447 start_codon:yes stop_codon:yes gene_type:complete